MEGEDDDMGGGGGGGMHCTDHPYRSNPGGICAFCLQEKLGKLVSSSFPLPPPSLSPSSSSSPSASVSSHIASSSSAAPVPSLPVSKRTSRLAFLSSKCKHKHSKPSSSSSSSSDTHHRHLFLKRSQSTATHSLVHPDFSPRKPNAFWSFLHLSSKSSSLKRNSKSSIPSATLKDKSSSSASSLPTSHPHRVLQEDDHNNTSSNHNHTPASASSSSFERKVSRSRSVGCGSRSFSGDFFERISTGFGDCTLRRVESQREGKTKVSGGGGSAAMNRGHHCMKERVRCGGLFSGFMMTSSSSSSSSSSYWVSSSNEDGKSATVALSHSRGSRSWGWAFSSPMRAFAAKPSSKDTHSNNNSNGRDIIRDANEKNATPNLSAMPSLLAVRG